MLLEDPPPGKCSDSVAVEPDLVTGPDPLSELVQVRLGNSEATTVELEAELLLHIDPGIVGVRQGHRLDCILGDLLNGCSQISSYGSEFHSSRYPGWSG